MADPLKPTHILAAALLVAASGLACRKPAPAPAPAAPKVEAPVAKPADAPSKTEDPAKAAEDAAEAARKAAAAAEQAYRDAAAAALKDVHFGYDKSDIEDADKPVLQGVADFMKKYAKAVIVIDGNCDERGTVEYNLGLGERRAHAAMSYLAGLGVPAERMTMLSYGKEKPVCAESVESCWARNRRAHFSLK
jgi:peptidoglycan-associated lipoprotein